MYQKKVVFPKKKRGGGATFTPILQMARVELKEVKKFAQGTQLVAGVSRTGTRAAWSLALCLQAFLLLLSSLYQLLFSLLFLRLLHPNHFLSCFSPASSCFFTFESSIRDSSLSSTLCAEWDDLLLRVQTLPSVSVDGTSDVQSWALPTLSVSTWMFHPHLRKHLTSKFPLLFLPWTDISREQNWQSPTWQSRLVLTF